MYVFKSDDAYDFARHVSADAKPKNGELMFKTCPYCKGGSGNHDKGTFAISLKTGQFHCLRASCGISGNMLTLAQDFDFSLGTMVDEYYRPKKQYRRLPTPKEKIKPKPEALQYLEKRGINKQIVEEYEITVQNNNPEILVFPFYDENKKLQFVKYRDCNYFKGKKRKNKNGKDVNANKEWCEDECKPILFGMKQCKDFTRLIICEGQLDSLSVAAAGFINAVSVPNGARGFTWIPYCWNWINNFEEVVVFGDFEKGHITLLDELKNRLKTVVKHVREEDYKDCKDANDILLKYGVEQISKCIENAQIVPIRKVIRMADVQPEDPYKIPKISTGIYQIDRLLYGGLPCYGVSIITGKTGLGKSTLASQIIINAIEQGYKTFVYSGELSNSQVQRKIHYQAAGNKHILEHTVNPYGDVEYSVSQTNIQMIKNWYKDLLFLYDNTIYDNEDETKDLLSIIEDTIMQYGVKVILIDNLMTAISLSNVKGYDKLDRQYQFVNKVSQMALRHGVLILLVAHMRKNNYSSDKNDEISGAGEIPNLASVILTYEQDKDIEDDQRLSRLSKNRLFGKLNNKGFILNYDEKSMRIYGHNDDKDKEYGWNTMVKENDNGFVDISINEDTPFS